LIVCSILQDDIVQVASEVGQLYLEKVDESMQSDSCLQEYVDKAIAKKKEELFTYFNKAQSIVNLVVGEGFMEEVSEFYLDFNFDLRP
jgi:hypothetical protein